MTLEEWRSVVGYEGIYEVSSLGRVRGVDRSVFQKGATWNYKGQVLKPNVSRAGYPRVVLSKGNQTRTIQVHRLVAEAFIPNPDNLPFVRHWNDVKDDNSVGNLRWGTNSDNQLDSVRNGSHPKSRRTHCEWGHAFDEQNTSWTVNGVRKSRKCRACHAQSERRRRARLRVDTLIERLNERLGLK